MADLSEAADAVDWPRLSRRILDCYAWPDLLPDHEPVLLGIAPEFLVPGPRRHLVRCSDVQAASRAAAAGRPRCRRALAGDRRGGAYSHSFRSGVGCPLRHPPAMAGFPRQHNRYPEHARDRNELWPLLQDAIGFRRGAASRFSDACRLQPAGAGRIDRRGGRCVDLAPANGRSGDEERRAYGRDAALDRLHFRL